VDWPLIAAGAFTGLVVGATGVGGGALMTPILLLLFGVAPRAAIGTDLWYAAITKVAAARVHHQHGLVDWPIVFRLWAGSLSASLITVFWMRAQPMSDAHLEWLRGAIAVAVCVTAIGMLFSARLRRLGGRLDAARSFEPWQAPLTVLVGAVLGALVTLTSVGAGALGALCLLYLYPHRLTAGKLVATDIAHAIPLALVAGLGHLSLSNVDGRLLGNLLAGSIPAAFLGARLSARMPHGPLRILLAVVLLAVGLVLLAGVLR
jgi:uncharacterized membrane protein YfcA